MRRSHSIPLKRGHSLQVLYDDLDPKILANDFESHGNRCKTVESHGDHYKAVESPSDSLKVVLIEGYSSVPLQDGIISCMIRKWELEQWDIGNDQMIRPYWNNSSLPTQWRGPSRNDRKRKGGTFPIEMDTINYMSAEHDLPQCIRQEFQIHVQGTQQDLGMANQHFVSTAWWEVKKIPTILNWIVHFSRQIFDWRRIKI